jgi:hypothetical protein
MGHAGAGAEQAHVAQIADLRAAMPGQDRPGAQRLGAGLVDMGDDRQPVAPRQGGHPAQQVRGAEQRGRGAERPGQARPSLADAAILRDRLFEGARARAFLDGRAEAAMQMLGHAVAPEGRQFDAEAVADLQGEHGADADLLISGEDGVDVFLADRMQGDHVLQGGDPALQAFRRAQHGAGAQLRPAARRIGRWQAVEQPHVEGQGIEHPLQHRVVGMVMGVDEARQHQPVGGIDHPARTLRRYLRRDSGDPVALDQDIGPVGPVRVGVVIVDAPALDQNRLGHRGSSPKGTGFRESRFRARPAAAPHVQPRSCVGSYDPAKLAVPP